MKSRVSLLLVIVAFCYGCAVVRSTVPKYIESAEREQNKIVYYLPKGMIHIQQKPGDAKTPYEFIVDTAYIPDPDKCYYLKRCNNILYNDTVDIKTDKKGLLTQIDVTAESKVTDIIMQVVETAKDVAKIFLPGGGVIPQSTDVIPEDQIQKIPFDMMIDPDQISECSPMINENYETTLKNINDKIHDKTKLETDLNNLLNPNKNEDTKSKKNSYDIDSQISALRIAINNIENEIKRLKNSILLRQDKCKLIADIYKMYKIKIDLTPMAINLEVPRGTGSVEAEGVLYRPVLPYRLHLEYQTLIIDKVVYLPNKAPVISLDIKRGGTVARVTKITFEEGILTEVYMQRPSEALGIVSIPAGVAKALVGLPLELLQLKVDTTTKSNDLLKVQAEQIRLERALLEERRKGVNP